MAGWRDCAALQNSVGSLSIGRDVHLWTVATFVAVAQKRWVSERSGDRRRFMSTRPRRWRLLHHLTFARGIERGVANLDLAARTSARTRTSDCQRDPHAGASGSFVDHLRRVS